MPRLRKAHVKKSHDGQWFAVLVAKNGEPLATTETQKNRSVLTRTLKRNFPDYEIWYELKRKGGL